MNIITIDKEAVNKMPRVTFPGRIHVISAISQVKSAVTALRTATAIGFDTETRPSFHRGERHSVALLQLSTHTDAFLFRLNKTDLPTPLLQFLQDPSVIKIGLSTTDDFHQLARLAPHIHPAGFVEIQQLVKQYDIADMSLQKIYAILFGQKISKSQQLTNWEAPTLTDAQQHYAAIDAWACLRIYDYLNTGNFDPQASPYYHQVIPQD